VEIKDTRLTNAKPWLAADAKAGSYALGLLGLEERKLLYHLARDVYSGAGAIIDLGAFCGASTCCLAAGLRDNPRAIERRVQSFDSFIASETYLVDFVRGQFGEQLALGQSFEAIFRRTVAEYADRIEVHAGDLLEQSWPTGEPIELLFVDIAKTLALSGKVLTEFFPRLIPGTSLVVHQDFYHPTAFYLPVVMDFLDEHFTIIETGRDSSVVFRLETSIPRAKLERASRYDFSFIQQKSALRRMMRRVGMPGRDYLRLGECAAIGTAFGEPRFRAAFASAIRHSTIAPCQVWSDGLKWCGDFNAAHIRNRLWGSASKMPPPSAADRAYMIVSSALTALSARVMNAR
jgi:predicted O-methyltransferase YrrM